MFVSYIFISVLSACVGSSVAVQRSASDVTTPAPRTAERGMRLTQSGGGGKQPRVTPDQVVVESNAMESQLSVMSDRANELKRCARTIGRSADPSCEGMFCAPAKLAFIHVYKSGGTMIMNSLQQLCMDVYDSPAIVIGECHGQTLSEVWNVTANYTLFTFVREPVSRFESSIFELARRKELCAMDAAKNGSVGDELALKILHGCLLDLKEQVNAHVKPQVSFLTEPDQTVSPLLAYVGHIENVTDEWPALVAAFFGAEHGAHVRMINKRDRHSDEYARDVPSQFQLQIDSVATRKSVMRAYQADRFCLGYEGTSRRYEDTS